jgi:hypothetical protein
MVLDSIGNAFATHIPNEHIQPEEGELDIVWGPVIGQIAFRIAFQSPAHADQICNRFRFDFFNSLGNVYIGNPPGKIVGSEVTREDVRRSCAGVEYSSWGRGYEKTALKR